MKLGCVEIAGEQYPGLILFAAVDQIRLVLQLDLVRLFRCVRESRVAARLDLRQSTIVNHAAVLAYKLHFRGGLVRLAVIYEISALIGRVIARDKERRNIVGLHYVKRHFFHII